MSNDPLAKAQLLREKRTIEARKKNLMGQSGKLGAIVQYLGEPIIRHGSTMHEQNFLEDDLLFEEDDELPTMDNEEAIHREGYSFSGLSRGKHFEIFYFNASSELKVYYLGYLVYQEIAGDLLAYVPNDAWESDIVENLYQQAKQKALTVKKEVDETTKETTLRQVQRFMQDLKTRWGL